MKKTIIMLICLVFSMSSSLSLSAVAAECLPTGASIQPLPTERMIMQQEAVAAHAFFEDNLPVIALKN